MYKFIELTGADSQKITINFEKVANFTKHSAETTGGEKVIGTLIKMVGQDSKGDILVREQYDDIKALLQVRAIRSNIDSNEWISENF